MTTEKLTVPGLDNQDIALLLNARNYAYYCDMVLQIKSGKCPFCELDQIKNPIIQAHGDWRIWECPEAFRAKYIAKHFVIAPQRHITHTHSMTSEDWDSLASLIDWATNAEMGFGLSGGGIVMRFGDPNLNAQSIRHLHCNIMVPDGTGEVKITLAKDPEKIARKRKVIRVFEMMRQYDESQKAKGIVLTTDQLLRTLCHDDQELVRDRLS